MELMKLKMANSVICYLLFILQVPLAIAGMQSARNTGCEGFSGSVVEGEWDDDGTAVDDDDDDDTNGCWAQPWDLPAAEVNCSDHSNTTDSCAALSAVTATSATENIQTECQSSKGRNYTVLCFCPPPVGSARGIVYTVQCYPSMRPSVHGYFCTVCGNH